MLRPPVGTSAGDPTQTWRLIKNKRTTRFVNVYIRVSMAIAATATLTVAITVAVTATVGSCSGDCRLEQCTNGECHFLPN